MAGAFWALGLQHHLPVALFNEQYLGLFLGLGLAGAFIVVKAHPGVAARSRALVRLGRRRRPASASGSTSPSCIRRSRTRSASLTWDRLVPGHDRARAGPRGHAPDRRLGAHVDRAGLHPLREVRLAPAGAALREGLELEPDRRLPLPRFERRPRHSARPSPPASSSRTSSSARRSPPCAATAFLTDVAMALMGRYRGGAAKMAVVSSSLYGTVSGSAVANVVVDGAITIPMMKRSGYPPHLAAAIEAVSSNGGQIMPPVMGAAAFLIAEYLSIPYGQVALAAVAARRPLLPGAVRSDRSRSGEARAHGAAARRPAQAARRHARAAGCFWCRSACCMYTLMIGNWEAGKAGMLAVATTLARRLPAEGDAARAGAPSWTRSRARAGRCWTSSRSRRWPAS